MTTALTSVLSGLASLIGRSAPRIYVLNPANLKEDLSERWNDANQYRAFVDGIRDFQGEWNRVLATSGIQNVATQLEQLFGESVTAAIRKQARALQELREKSALRVAPAGLLTTMPTSGVRVKPNTFHGKP